MKKIIAATAILLLSTNLFTQTRTFDQRFHKAIELVSLNNYPAACNLLTNLLLDIETTHGKNIYYAETLIYLATIYSGQKQYQEAIVAYEEAYDILKDHNALSLYSRYIIKKGIGGCSLDVGNYEKAFTSFETVIKILEQPYFTYPKDGSAEHWCEIEEHCLVYAQGANAALLTENLNKAETYIAIALSKLKSFSDQCISNKKIMSYHVYNSALKVYLAQWQLYLQSNDIIMARRYYKQVIDTIEESQNYSLALAIGAVYEDFDKYVRLLSNNDTELCTIHTLDSFLNIINKGFEELFAQGYISSIEDVVSQKSFEYNKAAHICAELGLIQVADNYYQKCLEIIESSGLNLSAHSYVQSLEDYAVFKEIYCNDYNSCLALHWKIVQEYIKLCGINDDRTLNKFFNMEVIFQLATMGVAKNEKTDKTIPILSYDEYYSIFACWRDLISFLTNEFGYEYVRHLKEYCEHRLAAYTHGNYKSSKLNMDYYALSYDMEARLNILAGYTDKYEKNVDDLYKYLQSIADKYDYDTLVNTWAEEIIELSDMLARVGQNETAIGWLTMWLSGENEKDNPRYDLIERFNTQIARLALQMGDRETAAVFSLRSIPTDSFLNPYKLYHDINEYIYQLLVQIQLNFDASGPQSKLDTALGYAEIAYDLILNNRKSHNGNPIKPIIKNLVYQRLGMLYLAKQDYIQGEKFYRKAIEIDQDVADYVVYTGLASALIMQGKYDEAETILKKCLESAQKNTFSEATIISCYDNLAFSAQQQGNWNDFASYLAAGFDTIKDSYIKNTQWLTSKSRRNYWYSNQNIWNAAFTYGSAAEMSPLVNETAYNALLFHKNLLVRQARTIEENILQSFDDNLKDEFNKYKEAMRLGNQANADLHESNAMYLYSNHPEFLNSFNQLAWTDVQNALSENDIAIEFTEIADHNDRINKYAAFIIKKGMSAPKLIKLCVAQQLDDLIANTQSNEGYSAAYSLSDNKENVLYSMIWKQLEPEFKGIKRIFFSPAGILHQINIEILSKNKKADRICEKYEVHRLSSTALLCEKELSPQFTSATLFGGLDYNTSLTSSNAMGATKSTFEHFPIDKESITRGRGVSWLYLGETVTEVETIGAYLSSKGIKTKIITQEEGTEETFKHLSGNSTSILHLATHGFYYSDEEYRKLSISEEEKSSSFISPLKRSGLILSGGNHLWRGRDIPQGAEDGTLTAGEIAGMDLTSTQLLVLSACQTGLGDVRSDGVYGLQHGFKLAGVQTIIMSLWEVSSSATEIMMTTFYDNLMSGKSKYESFINAQEQVRSTFTKSYIQKNLSPTAPQDPEYYWASFIMVD